MNTKDVVKLKSTNHKKKFNDLLFGVWTESVICSSVLYSFVVSRIYIDGPFRLDGGIKEL